MKQREQKEQEVVQKSEASPSKGGRKATESPRKVANIAARTRTALSAER